MANGRKKHKSPVAQQCVDTLVSIMNAKSGGAAPRAAAAQALLDRGWGKPAQVVTGDESGLPISIIHRVIVQLPAVDVVESEVNLSPYAEADLITAEVDGVKLSEKQPETE